jgi:hypothetical protein
MKGNDSKPMQRTEVIRLSLQNPPKDALRLRKIPLLMQRYSLREFGLQ